MKKSNKPEPEHKRIQVLCKEIAQAQGANRGGRYFITEEIRNAAIHLIVLVEQRKKFEKTKESHKAHADHIKILRAESDPKWAELRTLFEKVNPELKNEDIYTSEFRMNIAYRHFMMSLRRELGYPELELSF